MNIMFLYVYIYKHTVLTFALSATVNNLRLSILRSGEKQFSLAIKESEGEKMLTTKSTVLH